MEQASGIHSDRETAARPVRLARRGAVAVITLDNPPVNALSQPVRAGLLWALSAAQDDPAVQAVLIRAGGRTWPAGGDIREFTTGRAAPLLAEVCDRIAAGPKPVVVHMTGTALGGGLELALAAQVRLAAKDTRFGLPEVALGLCPGAGGTQRLPRLIGAAAALEMMLTGQPVSTERALQTGLIDGVATAEEAEALAATVGRDGAAARAPHDPNAAFLAAVAAARGRLRAEAGHRLPAPARTVDCVEASLLLPADAARTMERTAFEDLLATPESRALRHMFLAERRAGRHPRTEGIVAAAPARVAVAGGGAAGADLAAAFLGAWMTVTLGAEDADALSAGLSRIAASEELAVEAGRMTPGMRDAEWARLTGGTGLAGFAAADVGVLVGPRAAEASHAAAQALPEGAVLVIADVPDELSRHAAASGRGADVVGLVLATAPLAARGAAGALAEVMAPAGASAQAVATGVALARAIRAVPVVTRVPLTERIGSAMQRAADHLVEFGASPIAVDRALTGWGLPEGPFAARDRINAADRAWSGSGPVMRALAEAMEGRDRSGRASGLGFYRYDAATGERSEDPEVATLLSSARAGAGRPLRPGRAITAEMMVGVTLAAMANEGARLLATGAVARPSDIDVAAVHGLGFPRWRGGPMQAADEAGLLTLRNLLRRFSEETGEAFFQPEPLWDERIRNGKCFADLNGA